MTVIINPNQIKLTPEQQAILDLQVKVSGLIQVVMDEINDPDENYIEQFELIKKRFEGKQAVINIADTQSTPELSDIDPHVCRMFAMVNMIADLNVKIQNTL